MISMVVLLVASMTSFTQTAALATSLEILRESPPAENPLPATDRNIPQPVTFDECTPSRPNPADGYFKNRFSTCQKTQLRYRQYACPEPGCQLVGEAVVYVVVTRNMVPSQRRVVISHRMQFSSIHGLPDTTRFGATMTCAAKDTSGTADCDVPEAKVTKSIAEWKARPVEDTVFTMRGEDPPIYQDPPEIQAEKRTWYNLGRTLFVEGENGQVENAPQLSTEARCDEAGYVQGSKCVFPKPALFVVDLHDPAIRDYGRLVADAIHSPIDKLYPGPAEGSHIPGWFGDILALRSYPLTRTHHQAAQDASKTRSEYYCARRWGPDWHTGPDGLVLKCAVYPFNSTRDGAGHYPGHGTGANPSFAVLPLPERTFSAMEQTVNDFIGRHHILDGDRYWIWLLE